MEKLSLSKFKSSEISKLNLITGGTEYKTKFTKESGGTLCDTWYDDNEDGVLNEGDCVDFEEC